LKKETGLITPLCITLCVSYYTLLHWQNHRCYLKEKYTFFHYHYITNKVKNKAIFGICARKYVFRNHTCDDTKWRYKYRVVNRTIKKI